MLNQPAIASISTVPITKLQSIPEQDTDEGEDNGAKVLDREVLSEESEEAKFSQRQLLSHQLDKRRLKTRDKQQ
jgi:hypothetical protein